MRKIIFFMVVFIFINGWLSYSFKSMMQGSNLMKADNEMHKVSDSTDYLIAGNSHSWAIQTEMIPNSISIASGSEELHQTYFRLNYIFNTLGYSPKYLIFRHDLGMLKHKTVDDQRYQYYWYKYEDTEDLYAFSEDKIQFIFNRILCYLFPYLHGEIDTFDYLFATKKTKENRNNINKKKIKPLNDSHERKFTLACEEAQVSALGEYYFSSLLELCRQHDVQLILIRYPVTPLFYYQESKCFDPDKYYDQIDKKFLSKYTEVRVLDFHAEYDESQFADPDHLMGGRPMINLTEKVFQQIKLTE